MNSPKTLNYEVRPCKFVERRLLLSSLNQIVPRFKVDYQYIGFGGVAFTDFKLFHKELNINTMHSIEGGVFSRGRLEFNKPYSCINLLFGNSTDKLLDLDLSKPSIVWLDYDNALNEAVFIDIDILFRSLPHGSVYIISCNRELKNENNQTMKKDELEERFKGYTPFDLDGDCCADVKAPTTIKRMISACCHGKLKERNRLDNSNLKFVPLYNIKYQENHGARMYTYGGVILDGEYDEKEIIDSIPSLLKPEVLLNIDVPNLTYMEALYLNQILNDRRKEDEVIENGLISTNDLQKYKMFYKYMPNFHDVRV